MSHQQGEEDVCIVEGDWSVAGEVIESFPSSPVFPTFTRSDPTCYGFPSIRQRTPSYEGLPLPHRRVVSSPPPFEEALRSRNLSDSSATVDAASRPTRARALSSSHHSTLSQGLILSPPRRPGRRGASLLSGEPGSPPASGPPIGGFSIGLSPLSPGFTLVPRQRDNNYPLTSNFTDDDVEVLREHPPQHPTSRLAKLRSKLRWRSH